MKLKIDSELAAKIPPLSEEEFKQLEENILTEVSIITPIIAWGDVIVDGHNRCRIASDLPDIDDTTYEKEFSERCSALAWICKNQLGRRNLTPQQRRYLIGLRYEAEKMSHGAADRFRGNQYTGGIKAVDEEVVRCKNGPPSDSHITRQRIAQETGTSDSYVKRAGQYARGVDAAEGAVPGTKQKLLSGELKVSQADVAAVAKVPTEEREEKVREFGSVQKRRLSCINYPSVGRPCRPKSKAKNKPPDMGFSTTWWNGKSLETSYGIITMADVFMQLEDAAETMLNHWEVCRALNPDLFATKACKTGVEKLILELTTCLKNFEGELTQYEIKLDLSAR